MMSTPPRMVIQQNMARIASFYHGSAATPLANHSDFFNTYACFQQLRNSEGESSYVGRLETAHAIATSRIPSWLCLEDVEVGKCQYGCVHGPDFRRWSQCCAEMLPLLLLLHHKRSKPR